jgi:hypothetical protein
MSKPSQTTHLVAVAAGEILAPVVEPTEAELLRASWQKSISRGGEILSIPPRRWLVNEWLPLNALGLIYAEAGVGKSFYALSIALEIARGGEWCGTQLDEPLEVLYVAGERINDLRDRAEAWQIHHAENLPDSLSWVYPRATPQLGASAQVEALCQEIRARGSRVVVIDTYARMTLGIDENSSGDTGQIAEALDRIREATNEGLVLVVHHTNKTGASGMNSIRGSSALVGAADIAIQLEAKDGGITAKVTKSNASRAVEASYRLSPVALAVTPEDTFTRSSAVLINAAPAIHRKQSDKVLLEILTGYDIPEGFTRADTEKVLGISKSRAGEVLKELREAGLLTNMSPFTERTNSSKYFLSDKGRDRAEELLSLDVARKKREAEES